MKKMTIAEQRAKEVEHLAKITKDYATAENLMNRYYRLAGALNRLLYLENEERTCNLASTKYLDERADKMRKRLDADFRKYGLMLIFYGYLPTITDHEGGNDVIYTYFYN